MGFWEQFRKFIDGGDVSDLHKCLEYYNEYNLVLIMPFIGKDYVDIVLEKIYSVYDFESFIFMNQIDGERFEYIFKKIIDCSWGVFISKKKAEKIFKSGLSPIVVDDRVNIIDYVYNNDIFRYRFAGLIVPKDTYDPKILISSRDKDRYFELGNDIYYDNIVKDVITFLPHECLEDLLVNKKVIVKNSDIDGLFLIGQVGTVVIKKYDETLDNYYDKYKGGYYLDRSANFIHYDFIKINEDPKKDIDKKLLLLTKIGVKVTDDIVIRFIKELKYTLDPTTFNYTVTKEMEYLFSEYNLYPKNYKKKGISMKEFIQKKTQNQILERLKEMKNNNEEFSQNLFNELCKRPFHKCIMFCLENFNVRITKGIYYGGRKDVNTVTDVYMPYINMLLKRLDEK